MTAAPLPRFPIALYGALFVVALVPIAAVAIMPLDDYLNHLARMYVLARYDDVPALHKFFEIRWAALPNLAMEMFIVPLAKLMPVALAGKLYLGLSFAALIGGVVLVNRALSGAWSAWPAAAFLLLYNDTFLFGFQSYIMSVGVALLLFALWIHWRDRGAALRLAAFGVGAVFLYFCHLTGFGIYGVLIGGYELSRAWAGRRERGLVVLSDWLVTAAQFVVPIVLFVFFSPTADAAGRSSFHNFLDKWHYFQKATLLFDVFRNYVMTLDQATFALVVVAVAAGLATRRLRFVPHGALPFLALAAVFAVIPKLLFSSDYVDDRVAVAVAFVFVATTRLDRMGAPGRRIVVGAIAALFVVRIAAITVTWQDYNRDYAAYLAVLDRMPEGQALAGVVAYEGTSWQRRRPPLYHFLNQATITRHAFYPTIFAQRAQQPMALKPPYDAIGEDQKALMSLRTGGAQGPEPLAAAPFEYDRLKVFDYVFVIREHLIKAPRPGFMVRVDGGADFGLYRIEHRR